MLSIALWLNSSSRCFIFPAPSLSQIQQHYTFLAALLGHQQCPGLQSQALSTSEYCIPTISLYIRFGYSYTINNAVAIIRITGIWANTLMPCPVGASVSIVQNIYKCLNFLISESNLALQPWQQLSLLINAEFPYPAFLPDTDWCLWLVLPMADAREGTSWSCLLESTSTASSSPGDTAILQEFQEHDGCFLCLPNSSFPVLSVPTILFTVVLWCNNEALPQNLQMHFYIHKNIHRGIWSCNTRSKMLIH